MKTISCRFALFTLATLNSCAFLGSFDDEYSQYKDYVYDHVVEARLFTDGEQRLAVKALPATDDLKSRQEKVSPGFSFELKEDRQQVVVAVSPQNRIPFIADDLKFVLGGSTPLAVKEFSASFVIETLYPFAYPYYRVFLVDFPKSEARSSVFQVLSSRGRLLLSLKYPVQREEAKL
jgi:hypothetical protein